MDDSQLRREYGAESASPVDRDRAPGEAGDGPWQPAPEAGPISAPPVRVRGVVRELLETALFILLVFFIVRGIVQNFKIEGSSMEPTLHTG